MSSNTELGVPMFGSLVDSSLKLLFRLYLLLKPCFLFEKLVISPALLSSCLPLWYLMGIILVPLIVNWWPELLGRAENMCLVSGCIWCGLSVRNSGLKATFLGFFRFVLFLRIYNKV